MPINMRLMDIITTRTDLIAEAEMPTCLLELCAHVEGYRPVLKQWDNGDFSRHTSVNKFPHEVDDYIASGFKVLKAEQAALLGLLKPKGV